MAKAYYDPTPRFPKGWLTPEQRAMKMIVDLLVTTPPVDWVEEERKRKANSTVRCDSSGLIE